MHALTCWADLSTELSRRRRRSRWVRWLRQPLRTVSARFTGRGPSDLQRDFVAHCAARSDLGSALGRLPCGFVTDWSLHPESALWLYETARASRWRTMMECGCGVSTVMLALAAQGTGAQVISLEHDLRWLHATRGALAALGLEGSARLIHAPLVDVILGDEPLQAHAVTDLPDAPADFLLVDAPPFFVGRSGCLPQLRHRLKSGALVVLDDADRPGEAACVEAWVRSGLARFEGFLPLGCGLAMLRV